MKTTSPEAYGNLFVLAGNPDIEQFDILAHERHFADLLRQFLKFDDCCLYFPATAPGGAQLVTEEKLLLAPLYLASRFLGCARITGVNLPQAKKLLPFLDAVLSLCIASICLADAGKRDPDTGLLLESAFLKAFAARVGGADKKEVNEPEVTLGMVVIVWADAMQASRKLENGLFNKIRQTLARALAASLPPGGVAGRVGWVNGKQEFGVFFPTSGRGAAHRQTRLLLESLQQSLQADELDVSDAKVTLIAGHALYPQDMQGADLQNTLLEIARIVRNHARLAAEMVRHASGLARPVLGYKWIKVRSGRIIEQVGQDTFRINLGSQAQVVRGDRFYVLDAADETNIQKSKAQLLIREAGPDSSLAVLLHIDRPGAFPVRGDRLAPVAEDKRFDEQLPGQENFKEQFANAAKKCKNFSFILAHFSRLPEDRNEILPKAGIKRCIAAISSWRADMPGVLIGQYGTAGITIFLPEKGAQEAKDFCLRLSAIASENKLSFSCGIFAWPFLNYRRSESEACAVKALAYGQLLPPPHIGVLDHVALTINGDRLFSNGDELGAMAEYRLALLIKPEDPAVLNSLGVCMAALNRNEEAAELFEKAIRYCQDAELCAKIYYNLGTLNEKNNDLAQARLCFCNCIRARHGHIYAWIRLGQIYGRTGRINAARAFFHHAGRLARQMPGLLNVIQRHLARLEQARSQTERARELLHDALLRDPGDGASLLLLAQTYLEDDPATAEHLARRCLRLGVNASEILAQALDAQGNEAEAAKARAGNRPA